MEKYYNLSYTTISLTFIVPVVGYLAASLNNSAIHVRFGQRGIAIMAPVSKLIAYIVVANHPPFPAVVVIYMFAGFANGLEDSGWNAWIGGMTTANEVLGFLHGFYGLGGVLSPLVATAMITKGQLPWYTFYYIMVLSTRSLAFFRAIAAMADALPRSPPQRSSSSSAQQPFGPRTAPSSVRTIPSQRTRPTIA